MNPGQAKDRHAHSDSSFPSHVRDPLNAAQASVLVRLHYLLPTQLRLGIARRLVGLPFSSALGFAWFQHARRATYNATQF